MDVDLMVLQERCRKDPLSYKDDFICQRRHFDALLSSASLRPSDPASRLAEAAAFMGSVAHCYGDDGASVAPSISKFLTESGLAMNPDLRRSLVKLLGLLRAKDSADAKVVIPLFFRLLACNDKPLRRMLHGHIVADIKKLHTTGSASRKAVQSFLFTMASDPSEVLVKRSLHVMVDLFRKKIWNDAKCANMIAAACFHKHMPVAIIAAKFMLDSESKEHDTYSDDESDGEAPDSSRKARDGRKAADMWKLYNLTGKKSTKKRKRMEKTISRLTRIKTTSTSNPISEMKPGHPSLEAMILINDPQDFAERLFGDLQKRRKHESFENRLIFINLISRLIGTHTLIVFHFYPFLQRYLQPAQPDVTKILAYLTQACHDKVPSDVLHPILRGLADSFVSERSSPPSMAAGINTIRAICSRAPLAILDESNEYKPDSEQEAPLLEDLVQYKTFKDKGVMMAARSLIALYREVHPGLLHKKDRGRKGAVAVQKGEARKARAYGEHLYATGVSGAELLTKRDEDSDAGSDDEENDELLESLTEDGDEDSKEGSDERSKVVNRTADGEEGESEEAASEGDGSDARQGIAGEESAGKAKDEKKEGKVLGSERDEVCTEEDEDGKRIDQIKVLTDEDFSRIRRKQAEEALGKSGIVVNTGKAVDPDDIQGPLKKERKTLEERLETVKEGREGREKFGSQKGKKKGGGSSNKQKLKSKSNSMVIHKRRRNNKNMSRREKQLGMRRKKDYK